MELMQDISQVKPVAIVLFDGQEHKLFLQAPHSGEPCEMLIGPTGVHNLAKGSARELLEGSLVQLIA
ncbi:hypothetical protein GCM10011378_41610 [Hymenobacter glacieicola]|uniref:Uncharacterized protein n=1 Tax=Hymenobacter glacieicola TaxID=1562124 RepID=A0ABQ1X7B5_9BACT|nr:hypothetical protein GCM10011378_41610 [Hymenobacter glacieicola]